MFLLLFACSNGERISSIQVTVSVEANHTHQTNVTQKLIDSGIRTFQLGEVVGHTHTIEITEENVAGLSIGLPVAVTSTEAYGHRHSVLLQKFELD